MDQINSYRKEIDKIDNLIMQLLDQRFDLTKKIGIEKLKSNTAVLDTNREMIILNKISKYSHSPQIEVIYNTIMSESKKAQKE